MSPGIFWKFVWLDTLFYTDSVTVTVVDFGQPVSKKAKKTAIRPELQLRSGSDGNYSTYSQTCIHVLPLFWLGMDG